MSFKEHFLAKPKLGKDVYINESSVVFGNVELGDDVSIWPLVSIRGDMHSIQIGKRTNVQDNSCIHVTHDGKFMPGGAKTIIGEDVTIGHGAIVHGCTIGNFCLIGMGAIVLDHANVPDYTMIGANTLVSPGKKLESKFLYTGSPAKKKRPLTDKELEFLAYNAHNYVLLKNMYLGKD